MQAQCLPVTPTHSGGANSAFIAASAATTPLKSGAGRVAKIIITAAGTTGCTIFDNTAGSGNAVWVYPTSTPPPVGVPLDLQFPCQIGITVVNTATGPAFSISWD